LENTINPEARFRVARTRRVRLGWIVLTVLLFCGCIGVRSAWAQDAQSQDQASDAQTEASDTLQGTVLNSVTHEPIGRVLVASPDSRFATMTDDQGHFEFKFPKAGANNGLNRPNSLLPRKPGYLAEPAAEIELRPTSKEVVLTLVPEGLIVGRVSLPSDEAAEQIQVELYRRQIEDGRTHWVPGGQATTRSNGEFRFAELAAGTYKLMTHEQLDRDQAPIVPGAGQLYGYAPVYFPNAAGLSSAETISLSAGQTFQADMTLQRQPYFQVKMSVTNPPNGGLAVNVSHGGVQGPGYTLGYNAQTHTIEGLLPQGVYSVEGIGFGPPMTVGEAALNVRSTAVSVGSMTLSPAQSATIHVKEEFASLREEPAADNVVPRLERLARDTVVEMSSSENLARGPRSYLDVRLEPADDFSQYGGASMRPPSNAKDESLVLDGIVPGRYWVHINSSRGYASSVTSSGVDLVAEPLVVGNGAPGPIEITMRDDAAQLDGTIEDADAASGAGAHAPSAHVYCVPMPDSTGRFAEVAALADGTFSFPALPPGTYRVLAFPHAQPNLEFRNPEVLRTYDAAGPSIHLTSGQKEHLTLPLIVKGE